MCFSNRLIWRPIASRAELRILVQWTRQIAINKSLGPMFVFEESDATWPFAASWPAMLLDFLLFLTFCSSAPSKLADAACARSLVSSDARNPDFPAPPVLVYRSRQAVSGCDRRTQPAGEDAPRKFWEASSIFLAKRAEKEKI